ncbi:MAG TPA: hypothetical protein VK989_06410 [Polyangia bacterium]|jgi:hypothetical protein|nr:hypothetical protein [Polyangia bacterium]
MSDEVTGRTRYAALTPKQAAGVVGLAIACAAWLLFAVHARASSTLGVASAVPGRSDAAFYGEVVAHVRAGEGYYDVVGPALRRWGYAVRPVFNWRQPTYAWLLAALPSPLVGNALLALVGLAVVWSARRWVLGSELSPRATLATALLVVTMSGCFVRELVFMQESWAGALIALSVCLFALDRWRAAVCAGLAALAFRELALLPVGVAVLFAVRRRRWPEVTAWVAGLGVYALLMSWHLAAVLRHTRPDDLARGWLALGGGAFLVATCKWNPLFIALPDWAVALAIPFVLLGLAGWRGEAGSRVALVVYGFMAAFSVVGNPCNDYWGLIDAPLLTFGIIAAPDSVRELARALRPRR